VPETHGSIRSVGAAPVGEITEAVGGSDPTLIAALPDAETLNLADHSSSPDVVI